MKTRLAILGVLLAAGTVRAANQSIFTAPASAAFGNAGLRCSVTNTATFGDAVVDIISRDYYGTPTGITANAHVAPGSGLAEPMPEAAYCEFRIVLGSKKSLRGAAIYEDQGNVRMVIPAR